MKSKLFIGFLFALPLQGSVFANTLSEVKDSQKSVFCSIENISGAGMAAGLKEQFIYRVLDAKTYRVRQHTADSFKVIYEDNADRVKLVDVLVPQVQGTGSQSQFAEVSVLGSNDGMTEVRTRSRNLLRFVEVAANCLHSNFIQELAARKAPLTELSQSRVKLTQLRKDLYDQFRGTMSCSDPVRLGLPDGSLACYGIWDFSSFFGNDQSMCSSNDSPYGQPTTGCKIKTPACKSGSAVAVRAVNVHAPWHDPNNGIKLASDKDVNEIAAQLQSTPDKVRQSIIRLWEYRCESQVSQAPELHIVNIYEGSSNHSIISPVQIRIPEGSKPLILALGSYESVKWEIVGSTHRVQKVYLHGYEAQYASGVPVERIETQSYEQTKSYFFGINNRLGWDFIRLETPAAKEYTAALIKLTGVSKVESNQVAYQKSSFSIGN
jgi:hypothetical protein